MPSKYFKAYATRMNKIEKKLNPADAPTKSEMCHYLREELHKANIVLKMMMSDGRASERAINKQKEIINNLTLTIEGCR
jgi:hypothetical protein